MYTCILYIYIYTHTPGARHYTRHFTTDVSYFRPYAETKSNGGE